MKALGPDDFQVIFFKKMWPIVGPQVTRVWLNIYGPGGQNGYAVSAKNGTFTHTVNTSDYGGAGVYAVHIYAFDANGNETPSSVRVYACNKPIAILEFNNQK